MFGKLIISSNIEVVTGLHIGGNNMFSAIGAIDSPVIRDPYTNHPIIPGSSLKGKIRSLLSRSLSDGDVKAVSEDPEQIKKLFGSTEPTIIPAKLQFTDCFVDENSEKFNDFKSIGFTEIKFENTINRINGEAMPRQIERVVPGVEFKCYISYTLDNDSNVEQDLKDLAHGMKLLQMDYLGGHGSRGSGRVKFKNIELKDAEKIFDEEKRQSLEQILKEVESYELLSL